MTIAPGIYVSLNLPHHWLVIRHGTPLRDHTGHPITPATYEAWCVNAHYPTSSISHRYHARRSELRRTLLPLGYADTIHEAANNAIITTTITNSPPEQSTHQLTPHPSREEKP